MRRSGGPCPGDNKFLPPPPAFICCWQGAQRLSHPSHRSKPSLDANAEALAEPGAGSCPGYRGGSSEPSLAGLHGDRRNGTGIREEQSEQEQFGSIPGEGKWGWGTWGPPQGRGETGWSPACALSPQVLTHEFWGDDFASRSLPGTTKESEAKPKARIGSTLISTQAC